MPKLYSLNDEIYFKITSHGMDMLKKQAEKFHSDYPWVDIKYIPKPYKENWYRQQVHWLFERFAESLSWGKPLPVTDLTFENPFEADRPQEKK
jgi:hypothetical protein